MTSGIEVLSSNQRAQELKSLLLQARELDIYDSSLWGSSRTKDDYLEILEDMLLEPDALDPAALTAAYLYAITDFLEIIQEDNTFLSKEEQYLLPSGLLVFKEKIERFHALPRAMGIMQLHEVIFGSPFAGPYLEDLVPRVEGQKCSHYRARLNGFLARPTEEKFSGLCAQVPAILKHQIAQEDHRRPYQWQTPEVILGKLEELDVLLLLRGSTVSMKEGIALMEEFLSK